ncbi:tigger transposable element-derived protein 1 isoform X3 [Cherax quadricarinatus]|uniref:tigger transposable element-derived protein 1 isoform X3 n=1 Tax=Cherax quadricarinatus TaxID=27406 RepID=UPI00387E6B44
MASTGSCNKRRSRKSLTLSAKLEIIKLSQRGMSMSEIGRKVGLARQTVSTVVNSKEKVLKEIKSATPVNTKVIRKRDNLIADMEKLLLVWIEDQTSHNVPLSRAIIQGKALSLFNSMKAERGEEAADDKFEASRGWFHRFKKRSHLNIKGQGEAASIDTVAAESYPHELARFIEYGGYTKQQIFNVDETALYWKKMPSRTFIAQEEESVSGFKAAKDRLTLLLGANAAGDCKLKPMVIYHSDNPRALKNYAKDSLPVYYKSNSKAWMTHNLFSDWFTDYFKPTVEAYCKKKKIPFKILLLADNAPGHPRALIGMYKEINVIFMPVNTTSLLQPMNQGLTAVFKSYYLRRTFTKAITALDSDTVPGPKQNKLKAFWKDFTILDGIKTIKDAWEEVKETTLKGVWKKLIPELTDDSEGFENPVEEVTTDVVDMARELELEVSAEDVAELLASHDKTLTDEDLLIEEQRKRFHEEEFYPDDRSDVPREMTSKELEEAIKCIEMGMAAFERIDPDFERSSKVNAILLNGIACYKEILRERGQQSKRQNLLLPYFKKVTLQPSTATGQPSTSAATASLEQPSISTATASLEQPSTSTAGTTSTAEVDSSQEDTSSIKITTERCNIMKGRQEMQETAQTTEQPDLLPVLKVMDADVWQKQDKGIVFKEVMDRPTESVINTDSHENVINNSTGRPLYLFIDEPKVDSMIKPPCALTDEEKIKFTLRLSQVFTDEQEAELFRCFQKVDILFGGITSTEACRLAYDFAAKFNIEPHPAWDVNKKADIEWLQGFLNRHPSITVKKGDWASSHVAFTNSAADHVLKAVPNLLTAKIIDEESSKSSSDSLHSKDKHLLTDHNYATKCIDQPHEQHNIRHEWLFRKISADEAQDNSMLKRMTSLNKCMQNCEDFQGDFNIGETIYIIENKNAFEEKENTSLFSKENEYVCENEVDLGTNEGNNLCIKEDLIIKEEEDCLSENADYMSAMDYA